MTIASGQTAPVDQSVRRKVEVFGLYALGFGGILPAVIVFIANNIPTYRLVPTAYNVTYNISFGLFIFICAIAYYIGSIKYDTSPSLSIGCLYTSGVASIVVLHFLVLATGGAIQSCFAYHYLYIPAVVAITFNSFREAFYASLLCTASFLINLFGFPAGWYSRFTPGDDWKDITSGIPYHLSFAVLFVLQVALLLKMHFLNMEINKEGGLTEAS